MTWVGKTIKKLKKEKRKIKVPDSDKQINCIIDNLERAGVYHLDMHWSGKNLCLRKGVLGIIDFDVAIIKLDHSKKDSYNNIKPQTQILLKKYQKYKEPSYKEHFSTLIKTILLTKKNLDKEYTK